jgi:hypothetical protein
MRSDCVFVDPREVEFYERPNKYREAQEIWDACRMKASEPYPNIRNSLWLWSAKNGRRQIMGQYYVTWRIAPGVKIYARWEAFLIWMLCACKGISSDDKFTSFTPLTKKSFSINEK